MSYPIKPNHRWSISTPLIEGTKTLKIELFQIAQFKHMWSFETRGKFSPRLPFRHDDRLIFWESGLYRVRVNGSWYTEEERFVFMTKGQVIEKWLSKEVGHE